VITSAGHFDFGVVGLVLGVRTLLSPRDRRDYRAPGRPQHRVEGEAVKPPETCGIGAFVRTRLLSLALIGGFGFLLMSPLFSTPRCRVSGPVKRRPSRA
jgi:hypothetical protein